jgi:tRNA-specific 2-thiouridylase
LHRFTVGQRRGINCPAPEPYYVIRLDPGRNQLVVGSKKDVYATECQAVDINWINGKPQGEIRVKTRVRYRQTEVPSVVIPTGGQKALVRFDTPQEAVTPGQAAVFFQGDRILGGGWIRI